MSDATTKEHAVPTTPKSPQQPTSTEALRAAGYVHANRGPNKAHDIYSVATGEMVATLHAREVWAWLQGKAVKSTAKASETPRARFRGIPGVSGSSPYRFEVLVQVPLLSEPSWVACDGWVDAYANVHNSPNYQTHAWPLAEVSR